MRFSAQNRLSLFSPNTRASDLRAYRRADYYCSRAYLNAVAAAAAAKEVFHIRVIPPPQQALGGCGTWLFFNSFACARQHCLLYIAIIIIRLCTTVEHTVLCRNLQLLTGGRVKDLTFPGTYIDFFFFNFLNGFKNVCLSTYVFISIVFDFNARSTMEKCIRTDVSNQTVVDNCNVQKFQFLNGTLGHKISFGGKRPWPEIVFGGWSLSRIRPLGEWSVSVDVNRILEMSPSRFLLPFLLPPTPLTVVVHVVYARTSVVYENCYLYPLLFPFGTAYPLRRSSPKRFHSA